MVHLRAHPRRFQRRSGEAVRCAVLPTETKAFIFEFESATQANYDAAFVDDRGSSVVVKFVDAALGVDSIGSLTGFATVEGEDVSIGVPVQILY